MLTILSILSVIAAVCASATIICTLLTMYQFVYIAQIFNSYKLIQITLAITMFFWALRFFVSETGWKKRVYPIIFLFVAVGALYFMIIYVK
ncbi:hypothetical protein [Inconstantimicrobium mannanitabidum]|uniref:Uncharacterized protein n=1 Tax=Inconstantimicrobium mannanitabidum TaxID=1604901 RepID=A0ACB5R701_9CLOT|nr:hypothetical protein [Clostridium sp. TW13]GKX64885.1 hypothetical protein rsdtw13_01430 [Clostridium sp. TW13]